MSYFANHTIVEPDLGQYPSIMQTGQAQHLTDRYRQVPTIDVINHMRERNYKVTKVIASKGESQTGQFGRHLVRMRQEFGDRKVGDCLPELVINNSHDGGSRCMLLMGLWRVACDNGLVVGTMGDMEYIMTHVGDIQKQVFAVVDNAATMAEGLGETVGAWNRQPLSPSERVEFAQRAKLLRWGPGDDKLEQVSDEDVVRAFRREDAEHTLWNVFNRAQENLGRGQIAYRTKKGKRRSLRPLTAPSQVLNFNRKLWDLAHEFAHN